MNTRGNLQEFYPTNSAPAPEPVAKKLRIEVTDVNDSTTDTDNESGKKKKVYDTQTERKKFVKEYKKKQKTELCKNWEMYGTCKWNDRCSYAHGRHELVKKTHMPKNFMTKACEQFHKEMYCAYGSRCQFMHSDRDIYEHQRYTTVLSENSRLAKEKMAKVDLDPEASGNVYINVFTTKSRLSCFANITDANENEFPCEYNSEKFSIKHNNSDVLSKDSAADSNKLFADFDIKPQMIPMLKKTKSSKRRRVMNEPDEEPIESTGKKFFH